MFLRSDISVLHEYLNNLVYCTDLNLGKEEGWKCIEDIYDETPTGQAIKSNTTENVPVAFSLRLIYLSDFVQYQMSRPDENLFKVLY